MNSSLQARLEAARSHRFVGRAREIALWESALESSAWPFVVWCVHGRSGIGKTALLRQWASLARAAGVGVWWLDGTGWDAQTATPGAFCAALGALLNCAGTPDIAELVAVLSEKTGATRGVVFWDVGEIAAPLELWLRREFLPLLPDALALVLATRAPLSLGWRADAGWQQLMCALELEAFSEATSAHYLQKRDLQSAALLAWAHGHPLALALGAQALENAGERQKRDNAAFLDESAVLQHPALAGALLEHLLPEVPSPTHWAALELSAVVSATTQEVLSAILGELAVENAHSGLADWRAIFEWLAALPEMQGQPFGVSPRPLMRAILTANLRFRTPDLHTELHRRARDFYIARLYRVPPHEQTRVVYDGVFLHRLSPFVAPYMSWNPGNLTLDEARAHELEFLLAMVEAHEGAAARAIAAHWFALQSESLCVVRGQNGEIRGFLCALELQKCAPMDLEGDVGTLNAWKWLQNHAPLRAGEVALYFRFWMAREGYQAVGDTQSLLFVAAVRRYLMTAQLAYTFFPCADAALWSDGLIYADLERLPEADFQIDGRTFAVFGHDWRARPVRAWLDLLSQRETQAVLSAPPSPLQNAGTTYCVLEKTEFLRAVKTAMRERSHNAALGRSSLLGTALVGRCALQIAVNNGQPQKLQSSPEELMNALRSLLGEALDELKNAPRHDKEFQALDLVFGRRHLSQDAAASMMSVSNSTLRRSLRAGLEFIGEHLWARETGAGTL